MKKIGYIFLSLILLIQSGGLLFIYQIQQSCIRYEMNERLRASNIVFEEFVLTRTEFKNSCIGSDEVLISGKMYDVKSVSIKNNEVVLLVLSDEFEMSVIQKINRLLEPSNSNESDIPSSIQMLHSLVYIQAMDVNLDLIPSFASNVYKRFITNPLMMDSKIEVPPPKQA